MPSLPSQSLTTLLRNCIAVLVLFGFQLSASAQVIERPASFAVLDFNKSTIGRITSDKLAAGLAQEGGVTVLDRDQVRAAAAGAGYAGSINLSVGEARDLGAALGSEFFVLGDAQTLRRSPSTGPIYFDSYASIFLVSSRTGRLIFWERPNVRASTAPAAEELLLTELSKNDLRQRLITAMRRAREDERGERELTSERQVPVIEAAPDDDKLAEAEGLRLPRPYRRLVPAYPESAAKAEAEATVDVLVDLDAEGEVKRVEVARWAGFGLDQATIETVQRLHFFPAMREGVAIPIRVLLRYNFRKPQP
ncbi:MAG: TonB family protein [Acidobacteriota bacterium]|nr:TonB family protein [Acidobacteriota bacterium]